MIYVIAMVGETNRAPFDLAEAEGELVGGFHTEYSSLKFALFFLAEYVNMVTVSALATTLFLGGWRAPWPLSAINDGMFNEGYWPFLWFIAKVMIFIFIFIWLRGTLPRLRYDQFMAFGWKRLIPISLVWIVAVAAIRAISLEGGIDRSYLLGAIGVVAVLFLVLFFVGETRRSEQEPRRRRRTSARSTPSPGATRCRRCPTRWPTSRPAAAAVRRRSRRRPPPMGSVSRCPPSRNSSGTRSRVSG